MTNNNKWIEESKVKIIDILSYQHSISQQGVNYTGEKDWALNKIIELLQEAYNKGREDTLDKLLQNDFFQSCQGCSCDAKDIINSLK